MIIFSISASVNLVDSEKLRHRAHKRKGNESKREEIKRNLRKGNEISYWSAHLPLLFVIVTLCVFFVAKSTAVTVKRPFASMLKVTCKEELDLGSWWL